MTRLIIRLRVIQNVLLYAGETVHYLTDTSAVNTKHSRGIRHVDNWVRLHKDFMGLRCVCLRIRRLHIDTVTHRHACP